MRTDSPSIITSVMSEDSVIPSVGRRQPSDRRGAVLGLYASHLRRRSLGNTNQGLMVSSECPPWQRSLAPPRPPPVPSVEISRGYPLPRTSEGLKTDIRTWELNDRQWASTIWSQIWIWLRFFLLDQDLILSSDPDRTLLEQIITDPKRI